MAIEYAEKKKAAGQTAAIGEGTNGKLPMGIDMAGTGNRPPVFLNEKEYGNMSGAGIQRIAETAIQLLLSQNLDNSIRDPAGIGKEYPMIHKTLEEYIGLWLRNYKSKSVKASTYDRLLVSYEAVKRFPNAKMEIGEITGFDIQEYVNQLADHYAYTTIKKMICIVTAPLKKAASLHQIPANPAVEIELPNRAFVKKQPRDARAYKKDEQERLLQVACRSKKPAAYLLRFMLETGLRVGEALSIDWEDIDLDKNTIRIHKTVERLANRKQMHVREGAKTHTSNRVIPLSRRAVALLRTMAQDRPTIPCVFRGNDGERLTYEAVRYQILQICKEANVPYRGIHVFRHTFATNMFYGKTDIKVLAKFLGHSSTQITHDTYIDLYDDGLEDMRAALH